MVSLPGGAFGAECRDPALACQQMPESDALHAFVDVRKQVSQQRPEGAVQGEAAFRFPAKP